MINLIRKFGQLKRVVAHLVLAIALVTLPGSSAHVMLNASGNHADAISANSGGHDHGAAVRHGSEIRPVAATSVLSGQSFADQAFGSLAPHDHAGNPETGDDASDCGAAFCGASVILADVIEFGISPTKTFASTLASSFRPGDRSSLRRPPRT